jgi:phage N-6-adenine-methyltransferase
VGHSGSWNYHDNDDSTSNIKDHLMDTATQGVLFSSGKDNWRTPAKLFETYNERYQFTIDGAADPTNHLLPRWWGPGSDIAEDALSVSWKGERVWLNPPYSMAAAFIKKAWDETIWDKAANTYDCLVVALVASRTDTKWWHNHVWDLKTNNWRVGVRGEFLKGRLKFTDPEDDSDKGNSAPFPSAIIIFGEA